MNPTSERRIQQLLAHIQVEDPQTLDQSSLFCENKTNNITTKSASFPISSPLSQINFMETAAINGQHSSLFGSIDMAPADPILGLNVAFKADTSAKKGFFKYFYCTRFLIQTNFFVVNLGVGAYRTEEGEPWVLPVVRKVEQQLLDQKLNKEYLPQEGLPEYLKVTGQLVFGKESKAIKENRLCVIQSLSGTGALRLGFPQRNHGIRLRSYLAKPLQHALQSWNSLRKIPLLR